MANYFGYSESERERGNAEMTGILQILLVAAILSLAGFPSCAQPASYPMSNIALESSTHHTQSNSKPKDSATQSRTRRAELNTSIVNNNAPTAYVPPPGKPPSTTGSYFVSFPYRARILVGELEVKSDEDGFGTVICPNSQTYGAWMDAELAPSKSGSEGSISILRDGNLRRYGCSYLAPGTIGESRGPDQVGALAVVTVKTESGIAVNGVTTPDTILIRPHK